MVTLESGGRDHACEVKAEQGWCQHGIVGQVERVFGALRDLRENSSRTTRSHHTATN